jgi:hypothetical protein
MNVLRNMGASDDYPDGSNGTQPLVRMPWCAQVESTLVDEVICVESS